MKKLTELMKNEELLTVLSNEQMDEVKGGNVVIMLEP